MKRLYESELSWKTIDSMSNDKRYLVTGSTGFVGSCLVHKLVQMGFRVHVVIRNESNTWRINDILDKLFVHIADLANLFDINKIVKDVQPDIIYHLAAYGAYHFQTDTTKMIQTNITGTMNLINACSGHEFETFINIGSSSEYGPKNQKIKETYLLEPNNHYGVTKSCATLFCQCEAKNKKLPINIVRLFSAYGYFEERTRLVPTIIKSCLTGQNPRLLSPNSVRDFIFIEDIIDFLLKLTANPKITGEIFNLGSGRQNSIRDLVTEVIELTNSNIQPIWGAAEPRPTIEPNAWVADISKSRKMLDWKPKNSLKQGLKKSIKWYEKNINYYE